MKKRYWRVRQAIIAPFKYRRYQTQYTVDHVTWEPSYSYRTLREASAMIESRVSNPHRDECDEWEKGESWALLSEAERTHLTAMRALRSWTITEDAHAVYRPVFHGPYLVGWDFVLSDPREMEDKRERWGYEGF